jgi:hypothetical protein
MSTLREKSQNRDRLTPVLVKNHDISELRNSQVIEIVGEGFGKAHALV